MCANGTNTGYKCWTSPMVQAIPLRRQSLAGEVVLASLVLNYGIMRRTRILQVVSLVREVIIVLYGPGLHVLYNHHIRILWGLKYYQNRHMWLYTFLLEGPPTFSRPEAVGPKADSSNRLWFQFQAAGSPPLGETECFRKIAECIQPRQYRKLYLSEVKYKS